MVLSRTLTLTDLTLFGVASIMGSGGFTLIGTAVRSGGNWWIAACSLAAILLLGASHTYTRAIAHTTGTNTMESDMVMSVFGPYMEQVSIAGILLCTVVSISVILVVCSHVLLPNASWTHQILLAFAFLACMTLTSLQGIDMNRVSINVMSALLLCVLLTTAVIGFVAPIYRTNIERLHRTSQFHLREFRLSFFMFFFILAGFEALAKFTEEANDPKDISRSFFTSNILSNILTVGIAMAVYYWIPHLTKKNEEHAIEDLLGIFLGRGMEDICTYLIVGSMLLTTFVVFLSISRYIYSLGKEKHVDPLSAQTTHNVPYGSIGILTILVGIGILNNHTDTLIMISDFGLIATLLMVSAAATIADWKIGETAYSIMSGLTTAGFGGVLSLYMIG